MLARQALGVRAGPHRPVHLGGDHDLGPLGVFLERPAQNLLARALRIDVGGVEEGDPLLQRLADEGPRGLFRQDPFAPLGRAVGHAAEAKSRHLHAGLAKPNSVHFRTPLPTVAPIIKPFVGSRQSTDWRRRGSNDRERQSGLGTSGSIAAAPSPTSSAAIQRAACTPGSSCRRARSTTTPRSRRSAASSASLRASRSPPGRFARSRWARRSRPTRCSSGAASARCSSRRAVSATRSRSATRRAPKSSPRPSSSPNSFMRA